MATFLRTLTLPLIAMLLISLLAACGSGGGDNGPKVIQGKQGLYRSFTLEPETDFGKKRGTKHFILNIPVGSDRLVIQARTLDGGAVELRAANTGNRNDAMAYDFVATPGGALASLSFDPSSYSSKMRIAVYVPQGVNGDNRCELTALISSSAGPLADKLEPNDDILAATEVGPGPLGFANVIGMSITTGDVDYYHFGISTNQVILDGDFLCRITFPSTSAANLKVELFEDVDGTEIGLVSLGSSLANSGSAGGMDFADLIVTGADLEFDKDYIVKVNGAGGQAPYFLRFY